jgi:predicted transposase
MLLTLKIKLQPTEEQRQKLLKTMETFNRACDDISGEAYESKTFNQYKLHNSLYYRIREQYQLPAQLTVRAISKVVDSYKTERRRLHLFKPHGAIVYDRARAQEATATFQLPSKKTLMRKRSKTISIQPLPRRFEGAIEGQRDDHFYFYI